AALAVAFAVPLVRGDDPHMLPSALIDQPAPSFTLAGLPGHGDGVSNDDLAGNVTLLNFFASWCVPCLAEHPILMRLSRDEGVRVVGINYKDAAADAEAWLGRHGDPYAAIGRDADGRTGIDFGVYGVPETFIIDADGRIRFRYPGPLTPQ